MGFSRNGLNDIVEPSSPKISEGDKKVFRAIIHAKQALELFADGHNVSTELNELAEGFRNGVSVKNQRVRLTLSKHGEFELTHSELPDGLFPETDPVIILKQEKTEDLPSVVFSGRNTDSHSPYLFHKTTLRELYDTERTRAVAQGFYEVLFVNENGEVTEGSYTNIFLKKNGKLLTPPVSCGLLPGVLRNHMLHQYPELVLEESFTRKDVEQADAVYVDNSVRGLVRVKVKG